MNENKLNVTINTGTSVIQDLYERKGSTLKDEYRQATAVAFMDPRDMDKLNLKPRDKIEVKTNWGEVVIYADKSHDKPHQNMIFIPKGPWSNIVISPETYCCNVPTYKGIKGSIKKTNKPVLLLSQLIKTNYNKYDVIDTRSIEKQELPLYKKMEEEKND
ncbi:MAG: molybdopterin dinucleotide binding domain-containing protein [Methanobacteriaceae archaeon]|nr:molybdopterin dinucleotide binding domain-containing protein [Methanobacteriaceae archaeon]